MSLATVVKGLVVHGRLIYLGRVLLLAAVAFGVAGCGAGEVPVSSQPAESGTALTSAATAAAASPAPLTGSPSAPLASTTQPAQSPPPAAVAGLSVDYASIPQSKTPEGYFLLGRQDAPVLIQYYSDFL